MAKTPGSGSGRPRHQLEQDIGMSADQTWTVAIDRTESFNGIWTFRSRE